MTPAAMKQRQNAANARKSVKEADNARKGSRHNNLSTTNGNASVEFKSVNMADNERKELRQQPR
jgi:hypothetical protein